MPVQFDEQNYGQTQYGGFDEPKGISGWLISKGIAKDQRGVNMVLIIVFVLATIVTLAVIIFGRENNTQIQVSEEEIYQLQQMEGYVGPSN